ncbi:proteasome component PRE6 [Pseudozyma hubeiensis SY62]|uniref:Proteasome component PRE6 n=1 Tax=Pseudozyma hubeiensis (strain SY62) TaxID=1305764 RepID=R9P5Y2_PSEHS|nr:proteasome component PRE6 [Pseudozyma hubeiensis SY62]GAC96808.1 proteasome component PRE6 [Pseudozyma hubeiensis SY62]
MGCNGDDGQDKIAFLPQCRSATCGHRYRATLQHTDTARLPNANFFENHLTRKSAKRDYRVCAVGHPLSNFGRAERSGGSEPGSRIFRRTPAACSLLDCCCSTFGWQPGIARRTPLFLDTLSLVISKRPPAFDDLDVRKSEAWAVRLNTRGNQMVTPGRIYQRNIVQNGPDDECFVRKPLLTGTFGGVVLSPRHLSAVPRLAQRLVGHGSRNFWQAQRARIADSTATPPLQDMPAEKND